MAMSAIGLNAACADSGPMSQTDLLADLLPSVPVQNSARIIPFPVLAQRPERRAQFRAQFTDAFARALRARFANHEQVAVAFGVRASTAWNWWTASNRATGDAVAYAFLMFPDLAAEFARTWGEAA